MKTSELRPKSIGELEAHAKELRAGLINMRFELKDKKLKNAIGALREQMSKPVKLVRIGTGIGVRFTNEVVKNYHLKAGEKVLLKPEMDGIKFVIGT